MKCPRGWKQYIARFKPKDKKIKLQDVLESGFTNRKKAQCLLESASRPLVNPLKIIRRFLVVGMNEPIFENKEMFERFEGTKKWIESDWVDIKKEDIRYFTQNEMESLQTVPVGYTKTLKRNDAACLLGDGWTIDVISHILKGIK